MIWFALDWVGHRLNFGPFRRWGVVRHYICVKAVGWYDRH